MKVNKKLLEAMIKEELSNSLGSMPDGKKVVAFMKDTDAFIEKTIEEARKLADAAEEVIQSNILASPEVNERNELLKTRIGMLRGIANNLASSYERTKRSTP